MKSIQTDNWLRSVLINYGMKKSVENKSGLSGDSHCRLLLTKFCLASIISSTIKKIKTFKQVANQFLFCKPNYRYNYRLITIIIDDYSNRCYKISPENPFTPIYLLNEFFHNALKINTNYENSGSETV